MCKSRRRESNGIKTERKLKKYGGFSCFRPWAMTPCSGGLGC